MLPFCLGILFSSDAILLEKMRLLPIKEIPIIWGIETPRRFYQVLREPAPLAGMAYPRSGTPWEGLFQAGFQWVVNLTGPGADYDPAPLRILGAVALEDLFSGAPPLDPDHNQGLIVETARKIVERLRDGEGVVVHCLGGTGRTGTVLGVVLRCLGFPAAEVVHYLDVLNRARGKHGWPEAEWQAGVVKEWEYDC